VNDREKRDEAAFTELFHRLPLEPTPLGFREAVMKRIASTRARSWRWEWVAALIIAVPNLLFLLWTFSESGDDIALAVRGVTNALLGVEEWDASASVYVDGLMLVAIALVGLAALLATHALLAAERSRSRTLPA
jgi:hypothetical protein